MPTDDAKSAARELFAVTSGCHGHCKEPASFEFKDDSMIVQVCPGRYVSRVIGYGKEVDQDQFKKTLRGLAPGLEGVESADIRVASRYAWDIGLKRKDDDRIVRLAYWTQGYRRTKDVSPDRASLFLCSNKDSFFMQPMNAKNRLCQKCRT